MEKERKISINILLPLSFVEDVDRKRGQIARSEYLRKIILKNLDLTKAV